jgi:tripartite-type tricarboxylate transporter receptor subunit TctC
MNMVIRLLAGAACAVLSAVGALAEDAYPSRQITYVVPYPPGGVTDSSARVIGEYLSKALGVPVVIDNRGGAAGAVGSLVAARANPDGYTLLHATLGVLDINPHVLKIQYDPLKDFAPVANMVTSYTALVTNKDFPPNNVQELVAYTKAHPNQVFFASSGTGGITHIIGELFKLATGADITHVPYRGGGPAMTDLLGGRVQMLFDSTPVERVKAGQVKGLAAMGPVRLPGLENMPTIHEAGVSNFKGGNSWLGVVAPTGTPDPIVKKLSATLLSIAKNPEFIAKMEAMGVIVTPQDAETFGKQIREDYQIYGDAIKAANIKLEAN